MNSSVTLPHTGFIVQPIETSIYHNSSQILAWPWRTQAYTASIPTLFPAICTFASLRRFLLSHNTHAAAIKYSCMTSSTSVAKRRHLPYLEKVSDPRTASRGILRSQQTHVYFRIDITRGIHSGVFKLVEETSLVHSVEPHDRRDPSTPQDDTCLHHGCRAESRYTMKTTPEILVLQGALAEHRCSIRPAV